MPWMVMLVSCKQQAKHRNAMQLVLASSSPYRAALLQRLGIPFICGSPALDETPLPGESVVALVQRLALAKAAALALRYPAALIIGSDQACLCAGRILGKPGSLAAAREQLEFCSDKTAEFHTALTVLDSSSSHSQHSLDVYTVTFRQLSTTEINFYLQTETPFDCAGSFKAEGLGIALFSSMEGKDFHSLLGLPLISLCSLLRQSGLNPLSPTAAANG